MRAQTKYGRQNGSDSIFRLRAKNAAVAMIPAAILVDGVCRIENIPQISDCVYQLSILKTLGAGVRAVNKHTMDIDCTAIRSSVADCDMMQKLRASYYLIGALLGKFGEATVAMPGGCNFGGVRPIDQHVKGFEAMGAKVKVKNGLVCAKAAGGKLHGANIYLDVATAAEPIEILVSGEDDLREQLGGYWDLFCTVLEDVCEENANVSFTAG